MFLPHPISVAAYLNSFVEYCRQIKNRLTGKPKKDYSIVMVT